MTVKDRVQSIATPLGTFLYGRKSDININADNVVFPAICLIEPDDIGFQITSAGTIKDYDTCFIQFVTQHVMGEQANDRYADVQSMRTLAAQFVNEIINDSELELVATLPYTVRGVLIADTYDSNVVGIEIQLPLRLVYPREVCLS